VFLLVDNEKQFIPSIYNYCDRWCERCEFTARCRVFAMEAEMFDEEKDVGSEALVRKLSNIFADAKSMIVQKAEELGIDPTPISDEEFNEIRTREEEFIKGEELTTLAEQYAKDADPVLESRTEWLPPVSADSETQEEVIAVLYWYLFFIAAKIQRGIHGLLDVDGFEDPDQLRDPQSDANGSIKIALIAIERSILAWTYLLDESNADRIRPLIRLLDRIKYRTEEKFPRARDFVRPGFDEIETVM
jgi:hypothetical protein